MLKKNFGSVTNIKPGPLPGVCPKLKVIEKMTTPAISAMIVSRKTTLAAVLTKFSFSSRSLSRICNHA